jgi:outer membrane protein
MKKLTALVLAVTMSMSAFALKVGYVSSQEVFARYSGTKVVKEQLVKEKKRLENDIKKKEVELQKVKVELDSKGSSITEQEKSKFNNQVAEFKKYVNQTQKDLSVQEQAKFKEIATNIDASIQSIARTEKYDYVFEAGAVKFGGEDITQKVLSNIEKGKKIKLN